MSAKLAVTGASDAAGVPVPLDARTAAKVRASVLGILAENMLGAFATVTPSRRAHVHTAYFCVSSDLALYFLSSPASAHSRNLARNPSAAAAVFGSPQAWGGPDRGLQLFGVCGPATGARAAEAARLYGHRFPSYARWRTRLETRDAASGHRFYRFETRSLQVLDEGSLGDGVLVRATVRRGGTRVPLAPSRERRPAGRRRRRGVAKKAAPTN